MLLYGPPGTGKTLLARAVAGEAGVPFYSISGSDFVEMFVGVGASRVRDLFQQAKENSPAIIFVDEIDAVGRHRGAGLGGGHDEREQTLNQLLVEMDGFDVEDQRHPDRRDEPSRHPRPRAAAPGPLRPPDRRRRARPARPQEDPRGARPRASRSPRASTSRSLARKTPGFTGADLANVLNEAALLTARSNAQLIDNRALDEAVDRVIAGPQRRTRVMKDQEKLITAYHEGGHALAAAAMRHTDPVTKITILPRGRALGYTMVLPLEDKYSVTRNELLDQLAYAMGGRVAEEIVFHDPTTGASNDIEKATDDRPQDGHRVRHERRHRLGQARPGARRDVPRPRHGPPARLLGASSPSSVDARGARAHREGARRGVAGASTRTAPSSTGSPTALLEKETLDHNELAEIFKDVKKLPERPQWLSSDKRPVSDLPPVLVPDKAPIDAGAVDGGVDSAPTKPKRAPRRKAPASRPRSLPVAEPGPHRPDVARGAHAPGTGPAASASRSGTHRGRRGRSSPRSARTPPVRVWSSTPHASPTPTRSSSAVSATIR